MTVLLVTLLLICMSHCVYSQSYRKSFEGHDDIAECIVVINRSSSIRVTGPHHGSRHIVKNIGRVPVNVTQGGFRKRKAILGHGEKNTFNDSITISTESVIYRAIVYVSDCSNSVSKDDYKEEPEKGYDKNKVLWGTATLGVKYIPKDLNLSTLISTFWPEKKENVWEQIYAVIKDLLDVNTQQIICEIFNKDIKDLKEELVALNNIMDNAGFKNKYFELFEKLRNIRTRFRTIYDHIFRLYTIPLYTNFVTMEMYFYELALIHDNSLSEFARVCQTVNSLFEDSTSHVHISWYNAFDEIYDTGYAAGLYNVMMNARSYYTWHALELIRQWYKLKEKCGIIELPNSKQSQSKQPCTSFRLPISFSNLYGRATPNLIEKSTNYHITHEIFYSDDVKYRYPITRVDVCIIKSNEHVKTVYGLILFHNYRRKPSKITMGNCNPADNISIDPLDLSNKTIIKLKVYKTGYIRCLKFTLSGNHTSTFGDNCEDNSANSKEFYLEDHYIHSLYLENDYPNTGKYFDNVAVRFLPNLLYW